jgi:hypothetical protein
MSLPIETAVTLLEAHPYLLLFPLVLLEGPIATVAAGLLVATGIMSWPVAYAVAVTADLAGDTPYRRLGWEYPKRVNVLAEYWLETESPRVVAVIMEAGSMAPFGAIRMHWGSPLAQRCSRPWRASRAWRCSGKPCPGRGRIAARGPGSRTWAPSASCLPWGRPDARVLSGVGRVRGPGSCPLAVPSAPAGVPLRRGRKARLRAHCS